MHRRFVTGFVIAGAFIAPGTALAASGGQPSSANGGVSLGGTSTALAKPANLIVSASANGVTLTTRESALQHKVVEFTGTAPVSDAGAVVEIERMGAGTLDQWAPTARAVVATTGGFAVNWLATQSGMFSVRTVLLSGSSAAIGGAGVSSEAPALGTSAPSAGSTLALTVYRPAVASYYGGPLLGRRTACGEMLRRVTLGVASKTVACGTAVQIYFGGRTIVVPVIDRGPYIKGRSWDLTVATARALGMLRVGVATIGTVALVAGSSTTTAGTAPPATSSPTTTGSASGF